MKIIRFLTAISLCIASISYANNSLPEQKQLPNISNLDIRHLNKDQLIKECNTENNAIACTKLGVYYDIKNDIKERIKFLKKGCDLKLGEACLNLAYITNPIGGKKEYINQNKTLEYLNKAIEYSSFECILNSEYTIANCDTVQIASATDLFFPKDAKLPNQKRENDKKINQSALETACIKDEGEHCILLASLYDRPNATNQDLATAIKYYEIVINNNNIQPFFKANALYKLGNISIKNNEYNLALDYYNKACDLDDKYACQKAGHFYFSGTHVRYNKQKAIELYGKSCDLGWEYGCQDYKKAVTE